LKESIWILESRGGEVRHLNLLDDAGYDTIESLLLVTPVQLLKIDMFAGIGLYEILGGLKKLGFPMRIQMQESWKHKDKEELIRLFEK